MSDHEHVGLFVDGAKGTQPVEIRRLPGGVLEVLSSPGFVEGIAAGDLIRVLDPEIGTFEVVRRGGNLSVKLIHPTDIRPTVAWIEGRLPQLAGCLDGYIDRAAVLTIPFRTGFGAVEGVMSAACTEFPGLAWYYGNVYDAEDRPLNWWHEGA